MEKFYSKIEPTKLLHCVVRQEDFCEKRTDLVSPLEFLQCSALNLEENTTFRPHKHIYKDIEQVFPQESWCVVEGKVKCILYDIDDSILAEPIISAGEASFSFGGGHNYLVIEKAKVFEYKVGPYLGIGKDKIFI